MSGRPCNVSGILADLVGAARPLADKQKRAVELRELCHSLQVAVEESALRQALSNLIEGALLRTHVGGKVEIVSTSAPAGGTLVVIDDDGPDMHYMVNTYCYSFYLSLRLWSPLYGSYVIGYMLSKKKSSGDVLAFGFLSLVFSSIKILHCNIFSCMLYAQVMSAWFKPVLHQPI